jgi:prepilin-type N-terminal cleavage/methylation domain-containing protein
MILNFSFRHKQSMTGRKSLQAGFTLLELVFVIVILGVLAAVALPKFYSLRKDAEIASVQGTLAGFAGSVNSVHAYWAVKRAGAGILAVPNVGNMRFNAAGYPQPYDPATGLGSDPGCVALFKQMLRQ